MIAGEYICQMEWKRQDNTHLYILYTQYTHGQIRTLIQPDHKCCCSTSVPNVCSAHGALSLTQGRKQISFQLLYPSIASDSIQCQLKTLNYTFYMLVTDRVYRRCRYSRSRLPVNGKCSSSRSGLKRAAIWFWTVGLLFQIIICTLEIGRDAARTSPTLGHSFFFFFCLKIRIFLIFPSKRRSTVVGCCHRSTAIL